MIGRLASVIGTASLAFASSASSTTLSERLDVTGFRIGMPLTAVAQRPPPGLIGAPLNAQNDAHRTGMFYTRHFTNRFGLEDVAERYVFLALDGKVYYIEHYRHFAPGQMPNYDQLQQQTVQKYGRSGIFKESLTVRDYDGQGDVVQPRDSQCWNAIYADGAMQHVQIQTSSNFTTNFYVPNRFGQFCGPETNISMGKYNENQGLAEFLTVRAFDPRPMHAYLDTLRTASERVQQEQTEAAKGNAAPL